MNSSLWKVGVGCAMANASRLLNHAMALVSVIFTYAMGNVFNLKNLVTLNAPRSIVSVAIVCVWKTILGGVTMVGSAMENVSLFQKHAMVFV